MRLNSKTLVSMLIVSFCTFAVAEKETRCFDVCEDDQRDVCSPCVITCNDQMMKCFPEYSPPVRVFCICMGGTYIVKRNYGVCSFPDGTQIDQWYYYYETLCEFVTDDCPGWEKLHVNKEEICRK